MPLESILTHFHTFSEFAASSLPLRLRHSRAHQDEQQPNNHKDYTTHATLCDQIRDDESQAHRPQSVDTQQHRNSRHGRTVATRINDVRRAVQIHCMRSLYRRRRRRAYHSGRRARDLSVVVRMQAVRRLSFACGRRTADRLERGGRSRRGDGLGDVERGRERGRDDVVSAGDEHRAGELLRRRDAGRAGHGCGQEEDRVDDDDVITVRLRDRGVADRAGAFLSIWICCGQSCLYAGDGRGD